MKKISTSYAKSKNLKIIGTINEDDMSKAILKMERSKENPEIKYYSVDLILFNQETHVGEIKLTLWGN